MPRVASFSSTRVAYFSQVNDGLNHKDKVSIDGSAVARLFNGRIEEFTLASWALSAKLKCALRIVVRPLLPALRERYPNFTFESPPFTAKTKSNVSKIAPPVSVAADASALDDAFRVASGGGAEPALPCGGGASAASAGHRAPITHQYSAAVSGSLQRRQRTENQSELVSSMVAGNLAALTALEKVPKQAGGRRREGRTRTSKRSHDDDEEEAATATGGSALFITPLRPAEAVTRPAKSPTKSSDQQREPTWDLDELVEAAAGRDDAPLTAESVELQDYLPPPLI